MAKYYLLILVNFDMHKSYNILTTSNWILIKFNLFIYHNQMYQNTKFEVFKIDGWKVICILLFKVFCI